MFIKDEAGEKSKNNYYDRFSLEIGLQSWMCE